jgi:hypothetical protein
LFLRRIFMKALYYLGLAAILVSPSTVFAAERGADVRGEYMGQKPPGPVPEIFAPGIVSTDKRELNSVFTFNPGERAISVARTCTARSMSTGNIPSRRT